MLVGNETAGEHGAVRTKKGVKERGGELKARRLGSRKEWLVSCFRQVKDQDGPRARMEPAPWCLGRKNES